MIGSNLIGAPEIALCEGNRERERERRGGEGRSLLGHIFGLISVESKLPNPLL